MKIAKKGRGAVVTFTEKDAAYLAVILGYAGNAELGVDGTDRSSQRGRKMLFALSAVAASLDVDADTHIFSLYRDQITKAENEAYDETRKIFDPSYGTED